MAALQSEDEKQKKAAVHGRTPKRNRETKVALHGRTPKRRPETKKAALHGRSPNPKQTGQFSESALSLWLLQNTDDVGVGARGGFSSCTRNRLQQIATRKKGVLSCPVALARKFVRARTDRRLFSCHRRACPKMSQNVPGFKRSFFAPEVPLGSRDLQRPAVPLGSWDLQRPGVPLGSRDLPGIAPVCTVLHPKRMEVIVWPTFEISFHCIARGQRATKSD